VGGILGDFGTAYAQRGEILLGVLSWYIGRKREGFGEMKSGD
jgi:hypothetical protein